MVETDPRTWLLLATGLRTVADAASAGELQLSGSRAAEIATLAAGGADSTPDRSARVRRAGNPNRASAIVESVGDIARAIP